MKIAGGSGKLHIGDGCLLTGSTQSLSDKNIFERFASVSQENPGSVAIYDGDKTITYRDLSNLVERIDSALGQLRIRHGARVACCTQRSVEQVALFLALMKGGFSAVPINSFDPIERIRDLCSIAGTSLFVRDSTCDRSKIPPLCGSIALEDLTKHARNLPRDAAARHTDECFVYFTSGSAGKPKAVPVQQTSTLNSIFWRRHLHGVSPMDVFLYKAPIGFDIALWEIFLPLLHGSSLVIARPLGHIDMPYLYNIIDKKGVTVVQFVGTMLGRFLEQIGADSLPGVRLILCGGERWEPALAQRARSKLPDARIFNVYGQTETSLGVLAREYTGGEDLSALALDHVCFNTWCTLVSADGRAGIAQGTEGELYVGGYGLAPGYLGSEQPPQSGFGTVVVRGKTEPVYRTGDWFRVVPDGGLLYVGRRDNQVKISGARVELEEIEAVAASVPGVLICGATVRMAARGETSLLLFVVRSQPELSESALKLNLAKRLPPGMIPSRINFVDQLPVTRNGKLDRRALSEVAHSPEATSR